MKLQTKPTGGSPWAGGCPDSRRKPRLLPWWTSRHLRLLWRGHRVSRTLPSPWV